jgi:hypothetical protein
MRARIVMTAGVLLAFASCAGDGVIDTSAEPPPPDAPTLSSLQSSIFTPRCALPFCHTGTTPQQGMNLSDGMTFASTVGVNANELSGFKRVDPGHAADSYLYMKVAGDPRIVGQRMPGDGTILSAADIEAIRAWIDAGAQNN